MSHHTHGNPLGGHRFNVANGGAFHRPGAGQEASINPGMPAGSNVDSEWLWFRNTFFREIEMWEDAVNDDWSVTVVGTTPVMTLSDDLQPSHAIVTLVANDNDSWEAQFSQAASGGEGYDLTQAGADIYFECMVRFDDSNTDEDSVEQMGFFLGLASTDTTITAGVTDFIGFVKQDLDDDATQSIGFVSADAASTSGALIDGSLTPTGWTTLNDSAVSPDTLAGHRANKVLAADEWLRLAFYFDQTRSCAHYYINGTYEGSADLTDQIPNENVCPSIAFSQGEATPAKIMHIAYANWAVRLDLI